MNLDLFKRKDFIGGYQPKKSNKQVGKPPKGTKGEDA